MTVSISPAAFQPPDDLHHQFKWTRDDPKLGQVRRACFGLPYQGSQSVDAPPIRYPIGGRADRR